MTRQVGPSDIQPVQNETLDRIATGLVPSSRCSASRSSRGRAPRAASTSMTSRRSSCSTSLTGLRRHGRLSPPLHPPQLLHEPGRLRGAASRSSARRRSRARSSPGSPTTASTTPSPTSEGDPHSPHVDHGAGWRGACAGCCTRTSAGCSSTPSAAPRSATRPTCSPTRSSRFVDRTFVVWAVGGLAPPFGLGVAHRRLAQRRAHRPAVGRRRAHARRCTTSPTASTRCATSSAAGASTPATSRATSPGWRRSRSARRGTTTTTRSRPRPTTGCAAGEVDPSALRHPGCWRSCGLAWDVVRVTPERQARKRALPERREHRTAAARELEEALPERPFRVEFWDGASCPPPTAAAARPSRVRSPRALGHVLRAPGPARPRPRLRRRGDRGRRPGRGARRCSTAGAAADRRAARRRGWRSPARARRGLRLPPRRPPPSCARAGGATAASATRARSATTTTSPTSSSRSSSTSR